MDPRRCLSAVVLLLAVMIMTCPRPAPAEAEVDESAVVGGLSFLDRIEVTVVNLDVYVRDKDGTPVTGLVEEDFRVLQDGLPQRISNFAAFTEEVVRTVATDDAIGELSSPAATPAPGELPGDVTREQLQPVYIVLYIDNENIQPIHRTRVLMQVRQYIDRVMLPHVQVMVISAGRSIKVLQPFTNEPTLVRDALRAMGRLSGARVELDGQRRELISDMQRHLERGRSNRSNDYSTQSLLQGQIRSYGEQMMMELDASITRIREAAFAVAGLPGRKVMIHVSSGLPMVAAKDLINWYGSLFERGSTLPMLTRFDRRHAFRSLAATANAQGLSFYTIDATGLEGASGVSAEHSRPVDPMVTATRINNLQEPLLYLADSTGGRAILDANDVSTGLLELRQDLFTYYSLGYTVSASGGDVVHRVEVTLPEHPDHQVLYRRTMVERSRETEVQETVTSSLVLEIDDNPMGITLEIGDGSPASEDRWMVPIEIAVPVEAIALIPAGDEYVGQAVLFIATRDSEGRASEIQRRAVDLRYGADTLDQHRSDRHVIELQLLMREGRHRIAIGVLDVVTRQASFTTATHTAP